MSNKREISYLGPIYINNHKAPTTLVDDREISNVADNKHTIIYSPLDIRKYKIQTETSENMENIKERDGMSQKSMDICPRSPTRSKQMIKHEGESIQDDANRVTSEYATIRRRLPLPKHSRSRSASNDNRQNRDNEEHMYEGSGNVHTFKISSTEDNYVFDKFKAKSKLINENIDDSKTFSCNAARFSCNKKTKETSSETKGIQVSLSDDTNIHRDFLSRHRSRIAKLKRKFFESNSTPITIPVETISNRDVKKEEDSNIKSNTVANTPPPKPPHVSTANTPPPKPPHVSTANTPPPKPPHVSTANTPPSKPPHVSTANTPPPKPPHVSTESKCNNYESTVSSKNHLKQQVPERQRRHTVDGALGRCSFEDLRMRWSTTSGQFVVVVAIDFGTTYSGYAYSFNHDPETIHVMRRQDSGDPGVYNQKVPTCILLTPEGSFHSFGYAAGEHYRDLDEKEAVHWMYFDRFKMMLYEEKTLSPDTVLKTHSGKAFSALKLFSYSLAYFKELVMQEFVDQSGINITRDVIRWVITVPAIWKASAKQFMRLAAYEAGIASNALPDQLLVALEPEAASVYCRRLHMFHILSTVNNSVRGNTTEMNRSTSQSLPELRSNESSIVSNTLDTGTRYMVVDCGGGTVDVTVHELLENGRLKELQRASGGSHGSVGIDEAFEMLLGKIFGTDIILHFKKKRSPGWIEVLSMFESRKRTASPYRTSHITIALPFTFIDFYKKCRGSSVGNAVRLYGDPDITWTTNGMLKLSPGVMRRLFLPTVDRIKQSIGSVLNNPNISGIDYMFLVGGFSESSIVQHEMRRDFGSLLKIIIPPDVGMTILKGATCFGQDPHVVTSRCSCYTYGVGVLNRFDPLKHDECKKVSKDGIDWCTDVLDVFVHVDQPVDLGETIVRRYTPVRRDQNATTITIYSTDKCDVMYISDPAVSKCGTLNLTLADVIAGNPRREIKTEMMFGDTEIRVRALDVTGGNSVEASVDFINI